MVDFYSDEIEKKYFIFAIGTCIIGNWLTPPYNSECVKSAVLSVHHETEAIGKCDASHLFLDQKHECENQIQGQLNITKKPCMKMIYKQVIRTAADIDWSANILNSFNFTTTRVVLILF